MKAGRASVCSGTVYHRRTTPTEHAFENPMSMVWIDPDRPNDLCQHNRLYSPAEPAPAQFRRSDYGDDRTPPLGLLVRDDLEPMLGRRPDGPVRMLTQIRRFGWLFNPITVFLAWNSTDPEPIGAVLEVTNTPWKERHRYPIALQPPGTGPGLVPSGTGKGTRAMRTARFSKELHVSPFFDEDFDYLIGIGETGGADDPPIHIEIQLVSPGTNDLVLETALILDRVPASRSALSRHLWANPFATYRVSAGIHAQAARLAAKRVPFVSHPRRTRPRS